MSKDPSISSWRRRGSSERHSTLFCDIQIWSISEERLCKCVDLEKLVKSLDAKQQIQLDGFFATTPNTSSPKVPTNLKDPKGKESQ